MQQRHRDLMACGMGWMRAARALGNETGLDTETVVNVIRRADGFDRIEASRRRRAA